MGKTKTAIITGKAEEELSGREKYLAKQKKKQEAEAKEKARVTKVGLKGGERIKVVTSELPVEEPEKEKESQKAAAKKIVKAKVRGKKYLAAKAKVDRTKLYSIADAVKLVKETSYSKFDGTVELHLMVKPVHHLGKEAFSVKVTLPYSAGKAKKIEMASPETLNKLKSGKIDFDVLLATPEMMPKLVPFAKILGPKGLMPNPKNGTLVKTADEAKKFSVNSMTLKTEKEAPVIHIVIGKVSQALTELEENVEAIISAVSARQITKAVLTSTMGPGIKLKVS